ncbi:MAG: carboxypeptidase regulatory-like domain-containing protein, partial [Gemmatimonadota bacterium]
PRTRAAAFAFITFAMLAIAQPALAQQNEPVRVGVIGLDTSHAPAFARLLNDEDADDDLAGFRVVAAHPKGSTNLESSVVRQPGYIEEFQDMGITITDSIDVLLEQVDVVLLTTNDGHPRLEQTLQVLRAGKPVFVDKPVAASLADVLAIYEAAEKYDVPLFSSSSLRYVDNAAAPAIATIQGVVLDRETGNPIPSAIVQLSTAGETRSERTDGAGRFAFVDTPLGTYRLEALHPGYRAAPAREVTVAAGETLDLELLLDPDPLLLDSILVSAERAERALRTEEQLIVGRLIDDESGEPLQMGTMRLVSHLGSPVATIFSDDDGRFRLVSPRPGTYRVTAERMGYEPAESAELHLMPGDSIGVEFRLSARAILVEPLTVTASARPWGDRADLRSMSEFFDRWSRFADGGFGEFLTRDEIAEWEGRAPTPGHMLLNTGMSTMRVLPDGRVQLRGTDVGGQYCSPTYAVNGVTLPEGQPVPSFDVSDLEAVEVYTRPNIPVELTRGEFPCGIVAYWTRLSPDPNPRTRSKWTYVGAAILGGLGFLLM